MRVGTWRHKSTWCCSLPETAGGEWTIALNRHSSKKFVHSVVRRLINKDDVYFEVLADAIHSLISYEVNEIDEKTIQIYCEKIMDAYEKLRGGGVLICPTTVGYTLIATKDGANKMKALKGRPDGKPCGILGTAEVYKSTFGGEPPLNSKTEEHILGHIGQPHTLAKESKKANAPSYIPEDSIGPNNEVGIWLNNGPIVTYLATRLWEEQGQVIVATSCNMAGDGNPQAAEYDLSHVDSRVRSNVDLEVDIPHWQTPQLDRDGRWLSAPIWKIGTGDFIREGRDQGIVSKLLLSSTRYSST